MSTPVLGSYYTFKYIGGHIYDPDQYDGEGMCVGRRGAANIFATVLPKRVASIYPIQSVVLTYTTMGFQPIHHPSDKVILTEETKHLLHSYIHSPSYKDPAPSGRISPTVIISADSLLS
jgi:hypothetical protein